MYIHIWLDFKTSLASQVENSGSTWWFFVCPGRVFVKNLVNNHWFHQVCYRGVLCTKPVRLTRVKLYISFYPPKIKLLWFFNPLPLLFSCQQVAVLKIGQIQLAYLRIHEIQLVRSHLSKFYDIALRSTFHDFADVFQAI